MSNEFLQAADDANRLLAGFSAVKTLADAFAKVGQIQQVQAEAEARLAELNPKVDQARAQIAEAEATLRAAELQARTLVADAQAEASVILVNAQAEAQTVQAGADSYVLQKHVEADTAFVAAQAALQAVAEQHAAISLEVQAFETRVAEARAYLAKLAG
jgi:predicted  nucleic acid-binding Zn-ribbon protein